MSDRERWIVYPLLLLSLGIGVRGKFAPSHEIQAEHLRADDLLVKRIRCEEIDTLKLMYSVDVHHPPLAPPRHENAPDKTSGAR